MKKTLTAVCALLAMTGMMLTGAEKRIPVVWKSSGRSYKNFQTYAFGFLEEKEWYRFVFQIKNLPEFLKKERPFLTCYFNADNNENTGLYSGSCGWDLQFNLDLKRNTVAFLVWVTQVDESKDKRKIRRDFLESSRSFAKGEFSIYQKDDQLFISLKKNVYFKNIRFKNKFAFAQLIATPDMKKNSTRSMVETPQVTLAGSYGKQAFILPDLRTLKLAELAEQD